MQTLKWSITRLGSDLSHSQMPPKDFKKSSTYLQKYLSTMSNANPYVVGSRIVIGFIFLTKALDVQMAKFIYKYT